MAAKRATEKIPVVFAASSDPISTGLVASLARPGGNITGLSLMVSDLSAKRLELIHTLVPGLSNIAVLWDSSIKSRLELDVDADLSDLIATEN
jgi:putative ABC transport system substrate-binding protein